MSDAMAKLAACCGLVESSDPAEAVSSYIQWLQGTAHELIVALSSVGLAMQEMENLTAAIEARDPRRVVRASGRRVLVGGSFDAILLGVEHVLSRDVNIVLAWSFQIEKSSNPKLLIDDRVEYVARLRDPLTREIAESHAMALEDQAVTDIVRVAVDRSRGGKNFGNGRITGLRLPVQLEVEERELAADPGRRVLTVKMRRRG